MRYKVSAPDNPTYHAALEALRAYQPAQVKVLLPDRRTISVEVTDTDILDRLRSLGARVVPEARYDLEAALAKP